jgi:glycosyltransferase involved in cell wall biosynthesis
MRVVICQPLIPAYRLPLFERLGALHEVELTLCAGGSQGSLRAFHRGDTFRVISAPVQHLGLGLRAQVAQVTALRRSKIDLLILPWDVHFITLPPAIALARGLGIPVVLWGHGYSQRPHVLTDAARNFCGRMADGVLLYTNSVAEQLIGRAGFSAERVFVAQNALDQSPIQAARDHWVSRPRELAAFQNSHGINPARTMLFISRLERANRIDMLVRATARLSRIHPHLKTIIIGDGSHRHQLEALARSLNVQNDVIFTGAIYEEAQLAPWMLSASLFCYPVNIGLSLLHAFGYGLPTVTSDDRRAQNPEIEALVPDSNGLEYKAGNIEDMIHQCSRILGDPELQKRLSKSALETVVNRYSLDEMVGGFQRLFSWAAHTVKPREE